MSIKDPSKIFSSENYAQKLFALYNYIIMLESSYINAIYISKYAYYILIIRHNLAPFWCISIISATVRAYQNLLYIIIIYSIYIKLPRSLYPRLTHVFV